MDYTWDYSKMRKPSKKWNIPVPWGHIALASWGDPSLPPVLLVHGSLDSLATFVPLITLLPDKYYFVGMDLPGNGLSSRFPAGVMMSRYHMIPAIAHVVRHLGWSSFTYMAHSLGTELGKYYNAIYPGQMSKIIELDPAVSLFNVRMKRLSLWYDFYYERYYNNFEKHNGEPWEYTREEAVRAVERARGMTEQQAQLVLERNMVRVGQDKYHMTWDPRMKFLASLNAPFSYLMAVVSQHPVPTLVLWASESITGFPGMESIGKMLFTMLKTLPNYNIIMVDGRHDVHITHPHRLASHVGEFLDKSFDRAPSKL